MPLQERHEHIWGELRRCTNSSNRGRGGGSGPKATRRVNHGRLGTRMAGPGTHGRNGKAGSFYLLIVLIVFRLVEAQWISSGGVGVPNSRQSPGLENPTSRYIKQHYLDSKCADLLRTPWECSDFGRRKSTEEVQQEVLAMDLRQACPHLFSTCFRRCGTPRPT